MDLACSIYFTTLQLTQIATRIYPTYFFNIRRGEKCPKVAGKNGFLSKNVNQNALFKNAVILLDSLRVVIRVKDNGKAPHQGRFYKIFQIVLSRKSDDRIEYVVKILPGCR